MLILCVVSIMWYGNKNSRLARGTTVLEMVVAMSILTIVFVTILPLFAGIRNSWDTRQADAEVVQNGRVVIEHFVRNLVKAVRIEEVSSSSDGNGYIEFKATDGKHYRYEIGVSGCVRFGEVGHLSDLAGPVSELKFTCYSSTDLDTPTPDVDAIRFVKVAATFPTAAQLGQDKTFATSAYLRTRSDNQGIWRDGDIGDVEEPGEAAQSGNRWTIEASGEDVWSDDDEFHYVYRSLNGDGQIIARVKSLEYTDAWAKSGVMIRETLEDDSKHAFMFLTAGRGYSFRQRLATGGVTEHTQGSFYGSWCPYWVKLTRSGSTIAGYASPDGLHWSLVESVSINMETDIYVGLAVTACEDGDLCTSVVDDVYVTGRITAGGALIPQTLTPPTIDGAIDTVWSGAPAYPLNHLVWGDLYWLAPDWDLSGTWKALWDTSRVYYLLDMTDNEKKKDSTLWRNDDTAEIFIDADNSKEAAYDGVNDFHYLFRWADGDVHMETETQSVQDATGVNFAMVGTSSGYRLEISIPWSTLKVTPWESRVIGAEAFVDDDDDYGIRDATMAWYGTSDEYWQFPSQWGTAELTEHDFGTDDGPLLP